MTEGTIDRIGNISSHGYVSGWVLKLENDDRLLRVKKHLAPSEAHLSLAKPGDLVRLTFRKGAVEKMVNLSLTASA